jgi:hypothetical protein
MLYYIKIQLKKPKTAELKLTHYYNGGHLDKKADNVP